MINVTECCVLATYFKADLDEIIRVAFILLSLRDFQNIFCEPHVM